MPKSLTDPWEPALASAVGALIGAKGLKQAEVERAANLGPRYLSKLLTGQVHLSAAHLMIVARAMGYETPGPFLADLGRTVAAASGGGNDVTAGRVVSPSLQRDAVPLSEHRALLRGLQRLEVELEGERKARIQADRELIAARAELAKRSAAAPADRSATEARESLSVVEEEMERRRVEQSSDKPDSDDDPNGPSSKGGAS